MNLADSHDTDRAVSKMFNPDRAYEDENREQNDESYNGAKPDACAYRKARLLALLQVTYLGAPMVYYGDEAGMWGSDDPNNRKPMLWSDLQPYDAPEDNHVMEDHLACYTSILGLRAGHSALRQGSFRTISTHDQDNTWVFMREDENERILVALNAGDADAQIDLQDVGEGWTPIHGTEEAPTPTTTIPALEGRAWAQAT